MEHLWLEYSLFLLKIITVVVAVLVIIAAAMSNQEAAKESQLPVILDHLGKRAHKRKLALLKKVGDKQGLKQLQKTLKQRAKEDKSGPRRKRVFVIEFQGDMKASSLPEFREEITAVLALAQKRDEVVVKIESPGGGVPQYGLAAAQLMRLRDHGLQITACVDCVAASGGYLMAVVANKILASPFAIIGSIGVILQQPNLARFLKDKHIDMEQITSGKHKRRLSLLVPNTKGGREKAKEDVAKIHELFKHYVKHYRKQVVLDKVADGSIWLAHDAVAMQLVDELLTSDAYLHDCMQKADVYRVRQLKEKGSWYERCFNSSLSWLSSSLYT
jgi:serine protease SohB